MQAVQQQTAAALHLYAGGNIHRAFLTSQSTAKADDGHYGQQAYTVWATTSNVVATSTSTGTITTGDDFIALEVCNRELTLDCDGLSLDGH